ncbi:hypothetical protein [Actinophytocola sp.]
MPDGEARERSTGWPRRARLFEPFHRLDGDRVAAAEGTGLGCRSSPR